MRDTVIHNTKVRQYVQEYYCTVWTMNTTVYALYNTEDVVCRIDLAAQI